MDINKTSHTGVVSTAPSLITIGKTQVAIFTLKVKETWISKTKNCKQHHFNFIRFEAMGNKAAWVKHNVRIGRRYYIDARDRVDFIDGVEKHSKKIYHIEELDSAEYAYGRIEGMKEAFSKAISIANSSDSLDVVKAKLEVLTSEL